MKRRASRLSLHRETVTTLSSPEMRPPLGHGNTGSQVKECIIQSYLSDCLSYCGTCNVDYFLTTSLAC